MLGSRASIIAIIILLTFSLLKVPSLVLAEKKVLDSQQVTQEISATVMSPFCPGRLLSDCPSGAAHDLKTKISTLLNSGQSKEQVEQFLLDTYGDQILAAPRFENFGVFAWIIPFVFLFFGAGLWVVWIKANRTKVATEECGPIESNPEIEELLERELGK